MLSAGAAQKGTGKVVGTCELMCPAAERADRERDGNIRVFERVDPGNPNLSSEDLAVKIFVRTAVRILHVITDLVTH